ncbi:chymotrypsin BI-like [Penaeus indicus]|uniref:chymotrypsin BI-like n=1 Tax=Penaeus indicus TaxID=29960 RepID=UPI00300DAF10
MANLPDGPKEISKTEVFVPMGKVVTPTDYGRFSDSASGTSGVLHQVDISVMTNADCDTNYGVVGNGVVCVDSTGSKGTCNLLYNRIFPLGDSGDPLNLNGMTYGITSFGASAGCEKGYPDASITTWTGLRRRLALHPE